MNVLIFSAFHLPPHFTGINMEIIQNNIDEGHNVHIIDCDKSFSECGFNSYGLKYMCEICRFRENKGLDLIEGSFSRFSISKIKNIQDQNIAEKFLNKIDKITKETSFDNFDVGEAVYSSFISKTREREFKSSSEKKILRKLTYNSIVSYLSILRFIDENSIDKIFLFNGRWDYYRAALAAARKKNLKVEIFEKFRAGGFYEKYGNHLPHNISNKNRLIENNWDNNGDYEKRIKIADEFFIKKREGQEVSDKSYTKDQIKGKLPQVSDNKKTFVLFNSSDDEFAAVGKIYKNPFFEDQLDGILYLVNYFKDRDDSQLIIRMHPNLSGLKRDYLDPLYDLKDKFTNIILIEPESKVDTYSLMDFGDTIISFGSTAGVEASYWGKPVILLGKCFYFNSNIAHVPNSKEDIPRLLEANLEPHDKIFSRKFGYYIMKGGIKGKYYFNTDKKESFFKNTSLNKLPFWFKLYYKFLKKISIKN